MKKYKLIKSYPGFKAPLEAQQTDASANIVSPWYKILQRPAGIIHKDFIENQPEYWELVIEKPEYVKYIGWKSSIAEQGKIYPVSKTGDKVLETTPGGVFTWNGGGFEPATKEEYDKQQRKPLFKTEDGVDIYTGDKYCYINSIGGRSGLQEACGTTSEAYSKGSPKYFSTIEAADNWLNANKPKYTVNDVLAIMELSETTFDAPIYVIEEYNKKKGIK